MKKMKRLSLFLCLILALQCVLIPAAATETTEDLFTTDDLVAADETVAQAADVPFGSVCIQNGCRTIEGMVPLAGSDRKLNTSQAAFVYEANTGTVIYSYNPDVKLSTGTMSKMVLALVAIENCDLDEVVTCSEGIQSKVPGSATTLKPYLKSGEQLTMEDLLHALLLEIANDAAVAIAEHVAGTTTACVELMNKRARQMGCTNTEFGNISGLDTATSYTTARDMARIMAAAAENETFVEISKATTYTIPATNMVEERELRTTNYLIDDYVIPQFYDKRVTCGMASYSETSGANLACVATNISETNPNGMKLVCVTLGGIRVYEEGKWSPVSYGNFEEMVELLKYAFDNFKVNRIVYDGMSLNQWPVANGECEVVGQADVNIDSVVLSSSKMKNLQMKYTVVGGGLSAPVAKDELIATVSIWYQSSCLAEAEVFAMSEVRKTGDTGVTIRSTASRSDSDASGVMSVIGTVCVIILGIVGVYLAWNSYMRSRMRARRRKRRAARRRIR